MKEDLKMEIYLDHAATTWVYPEAVEKMNRIMLEDYGNPSSMHMMGVNAEKYVRETGEILSGILKVPEKSIYYTSGGTESNNWAIFGTAMAKRRMGRHIITTAIEHSAVAAPLEFLKKEGYTVTKLGVDRFGNIDLDELKEAVTPETVLVSVMLVNNEIGTVSNPKAIGDAIKSVNPETVFHVDAIQGFGKMTIHPERMNIDLLSVSGHKFHGPKGTGFLYASEKVRLLPLIYGGGQQNGMRSGTDNVPGIAGMGTAAKMIYSTLSENRENMYKVRSHLISRFEKMENVVIHGDKTEASAPHVLNASFIGVRSEVILHALEEKGIYISAGSACSSHKRHQSDTLTAIGCSKKELESAVRFSFCEKTTMEEADIAADALEELLPQLRRFTRR